MGKSKNKARREWKKRTAASVTPKHIKLRSANIPSTLHKLFKWKNLCGFSGGQVESDRSKH